MDNLGMDKIISNPALIDLIARLEEEAEYCPNCGAIFAEEDVAWLKVCGYCGHEWEDPDGFAMA